MLVELTLLVMVWDGGNTTTHWDQTQTKYPSVELCEKAASALIKKKNQRMTKAKVLEHRCEPMKDTPPPYIMQQTIDEQKKEIERLHFLTEAAYKRGVHDAYNIVNDEYYYKQLRNRLKWRLDDLVQKK